MLLIVIATFVVAYALYIAGMIQLNAGYVGSSRLIKVNSWQKCLKLIKRGWMAYLVSLVAIVVDMLLIELHYPAKWGWGIISVMLILGSLFLILLGAMPYQDDNPHNPNPPPRVW